MRLEKFFLSLLGNPFDQASWEKVVQFNKPKAKFPTWIVPMLSNEQLLPRKTHKSIRQLRLKIIFIRQDNIPTSIAINNIENFVFSIGTLGKALSGRINTSVENCNNYIPSIVIWMFGEEFFSLSLSFWLQAFEGKRFHSAGRKGCSIWLSWNYLN